MLCGTLYEAELAIRKYRDDENWRAQYGSIYEKIDRALFASVKLRLEIAAAKNEPSDLLWQAVNSENYARYGELDGQHRKVPQLTRRNGRHPSAAAM